MKKLLCFSISLVLIFTSCSSILEPTVERIEDVDIVKMTKDNLELQGYEITYCGDGSEKPKWF